MQRQMHQYVPVDILINLLSEIPESKPNHTFFQLDNGAWTAFNSEQTVKLLMYNKFKAFKMITIHITLEELYLLTKLNLVSLDVYFDQQTEH